MAYTRVMYGGVMIIVLFCVLGILLVDDAVSAELYRYQDSNGRWVFGDKKSLSDRPKNLNSEAEKITIKDQRKLHAKPIMELTRQDKLLANRLWILKNPLPVSVQHWIAIKGQKGFVKSLLAQPFEDKYLTASDMDLDLSVGNKSKINQTKFKHYYLLGEPVKAPTQVLVTPPYGKNKRFRISQGFKGRFSHFGRGNRFAVDIAMPVGEKVRAVKAGIVADGRDDFSVGGAANYFLDKANHVTIMHDDGTYGIYAHILYGSMAVAIGKRVRAGDVLARIGSTGYSTGPHLHFVMRYNSGKGAYSVPFKFQTKQGAKTPKQGEHYSGGYDN